MKNEYPTMNKVNNTPEKRTVLKFKEFCATTNGILFGSGIFLVLLRFYFNIPFSGFWKQYFIFTLPWFVLWGIRRFIPSIFSLSLAVLCAWQFRHVVRYSREQWVLQYQGDPVAAAAAGPFPVSGLLEWSIFVNILLVGFFFHAFSGENQKKAIKE